MDIKSKFLELTSRTYPHGTEGDLFHLLPQDLDIDEFGNLFKVIGSNPTTIFACHLDTATSALTEVNHVLSGDMIYTDGTTILGADDKAGVVILLYMMEHKIPGIYYFFMGEEVGCVGSKKVADQHKTSKIEGITKVISFDRRGTGSIITFQCSSRCCSDEFGTSLAEALNDAGLLVEDNDTILSYKNDPTGLYTDSAQFIKIYPECTNISVGYRNEHTYTEEQNIKHLEKLAKAAILVDWEKLPISRDPSKVEYDYSGWDYDGYGYGYRGYTPPSTQRSLATYVNQENVWFIDDENDDYCSSITVNKNTKKVVKVDLSETRVQYEADTICQFLLALDVDFKNLLWDGFDLEVFYEDGHKTECTRNEINEYIPELDFWTVFQVETVKKESTYPKNLSWGENYGEYD